MDQKCPQVTVPFVVDLEPAKYGAKLSATYRSIPRILPKPTVASLPPPFGPALLPPRFIQCECL